MADASTSSEGEVKFLLAVIRQMDGQIDWDKIAKECGIVSKAAAQKRFSRLKMKYNGKTGAASADDSKSDTADGEQVRKTASKKGAGRKPAANKKRKADEAVAEESEEQEIEHIKDEE